ncbi:MAG: hypothetical protein ABSG51_03980 [Terracidiphilus sp.]|jgi:hypothetical protein
MSMVEWVAAVQTGGIESESSNSAGAGYLVIALLAVAVWLVAMMLIQTSGRRSSRR